MSKDSVDKPDEYENLFDEAYPVKEEGVVNPASLDAEIIETLNSPSENLENSSDIDSVYKKENSDFLDTDIEDGIFAPERKVIKTSKKSSHLMLSVSILAVIGVAGYVYISNPDIISKISGNLVSNNEVVLPQETPLEATELVVSKPEDEKIAVETNSQEEVIIPQIENEVDLKPELPIESTSTTEVTATVDAKTEATLEPIIPPSNEFQELEPAKNLNVQPNPELAVADPIVNSQESVPVLEPVIEKDKKEDVTIPESTVATNSSVIPPYKTEISKVEEVKVDVKKENIDAPKENIVVLNSKEEQKILDDAKLDKYFDSPNGKMLREIPAPSMDPKKGSGESIIIVNKKSTPPVLSKNIEIETTDLTRQTISANRALKLGRYEAAKEMYENLYRINPKDEGVLSGRALVLQKMGMNEQAISAYEQLLKLYPDNIDAIVNLSGIIRKEYPAVALNKLLDLHERYPNNVFVIAQLGVTYADAGNYKEAIRSLSIAGEMDPKNALHFYNLAIIFEKESNSKEAIRNYEKALEVDSIFGEGKRLVSREKIYDRLAFLRNN